VCNIIYRAGLLPFTATFTALSNGLYSRGDCYVVNNRYARVYKGQRYNVIEDRRELW
jgi:hypothetical protein